MNPVIENELIKQITTHFTRSSQQLNGIQQSDSEIVDLSSYTNPWLAITTDSIVEEIDLGLYDDPYLIGWMIVMVNMSDLAAVGAKPIGILISEIIPYGYSNSDLLKIQTGINDACSECETFVLGGDTNAGNNLILTGCAIGINSLNDPNYRTGCHTGDLLYSSGYLGQGNAFAISKLLSEKQTHFEYRPIAKINAGHALCGVATSCMDTSDGLISTLDQLMRLNNVGFELDNEWENAINASSLLIAKEVGLPSWFLLAGIHGEFELVFTIPQDKKNIFLDLASQISWKPIKIGKVTENIEMIIPINGKQISIDSTKVRNLSYLSSNDVHEYVNRLLKINKQLPHFDDFMT